MNGEDMKSYRTKSFRDAFDNLSEDRKKKATEVFQKWKENPTSINGNFCVSMNRRDVFVARIGLNDRAIAIKDNINNEDVYMWSWIGSHEDYNKIIKSCSKLETMTKVQQNKNIDRIAKNTNADDLEGLKSDARFKEKLANRRKNSNNQQSYNKNKNIKS